jgi:N-acetylglucosamine repressor
MNELVRRGTRGLLRDMNNSRVLQIIQAHGPISRAEIAKIGDLQPPTVTAIVNDFLRADLVRETDLVRDNGNGSAAIGRRPILLCLNETAAFAVGVKLRQNGMTIAVTDLGGTIVYLSESALPNRTPDEALRFIADRVENAIEVAAVNIAKVIGLGIGMPGMVDFRNGVCVFSPLLEWETVHVTSTLESILGMPAYADNDVNMLTAAEIAYGEGREVSDFLTVTIGQGIGLGIVLRGEIFRGAGGGAGEFGHVKIDSDLLCECGARGCLEAVASDVGISMQVAAAKHLSSIGIDEALDLARAGDSEVVAIVEHAGEVLGRSIGNLLNLFNPELVIVTGEGTRAGDLLFAPMRLALEGAAFGTLGRDTRVIVQSLGDEAWARGAASIVVHEMLKPPIYESRSAGPLVHLLARSIQRGTT